MALADVNTSEPWVQKKMNDWVRDLVDTFKSMFYHCDCKWPHADVLVDGLRIDTAKHMGKSFLSSFTDAAGVFTTGEVYHADLTYTCPYQAHVNGLLNYPL